MELIEFITNLYHPCLANRIINGTQHTVIWHVDDLKSSQKFATANENFHD
jgi:hypothetical protein